MGGQACERQNGPHPAGGPKVSCQGRDEHGRSMHTLAMCRISNARRRKGCDWRVHGPIRPSSVRQPSARVQRPDLRQQRPRTIASNHGRRQFEKLSLQLAIRQRLLGVALAVGLQVQQALRVTTPATTSRVPARWEARHGLPFAARTGARGYGRLSATQGAPCSDGANATNWSRPIEHPPRYHSTVTLFARLRGLSTSVPRAQAV